MCNILQKLASHVFKTLSYLALDACRLHLVRATPDRTVVDQVLDSLSRVALFTIAGCLGAFTHDVAFSGAVVNQLITFAFCACLQIVVSAM